MTVRRYRHWNRADGPTEQSCARCGVVQPIAAFRLQKGRWRSAWCDGCYVARTREWRAQNRERLVAERRAAYPPRKAYPPKPCASCGVDFITNDVRGRYCSPICRQDAHAAKVSQAEQSPERLIAKRVNAALRPLVLAAHGWTCHLCGGRIDRAVSGNHRVGLTLDHVVPVIQGGPSELANLRPAHRWCNLARNARPGLTEDQALKGYLMAELSLRAGERLRKAAA